MLFNPYNVYGDCPVYKPTQQSVREYLFNPELREKNGVPPCADVQGLFTLLRNPNMLKALHIKDGSAQWDICSPISYKRDAKESYYLYPKLIKHGIRIWKFSGDVMK